MIDDQYVNVIRQAENLLANHFDQQLRFGEIVPIQTEGRFLIFRCHVEEHSDDIPSSVIIKQMNVDLTGTKRNEVAQTSRNERAVLRLFTNQPSAPRPGPRFYAGDPDKGCLILEDLGDYPLLQDLLYKEDAQQAREGLMQYGRYLAGMQLLVRDQAERYAANLKAINGRPQRDVFGWDLRDHLSDLHTCLHALQVEPDNKFDQAVQDLAQTIQDPGPFYTLSHCDAGPHNIMVLPNQLILFDFELACFQHGFVDLVQARMAFPSAGFGRRSPKMIVEQMEKAYRQELIKEIPEASDDQLFEQALVEACAHIVLTSLLDYGRDGLSRMLTETTTGDKPDFGIQRLVTFLSAFLDTSKQFNKLPQIRAIVQQISDKLLLHQPEVEQLTVFPALMIVYGEGETGGFRN